MKMLYFIHTESGWKQATYEEYHAFEGKKEIRPPHWGMIQLQKYLGKYRY